MTDTNTTEKLQVETATPAAEFAPVAARKKAAKRRHVKAAAKPAIEPIRAAQERMPLGRPSKYRPEMCEAMRDYFNISVETRRFPTFARFAGTVGVTRVTLRRWATATNADGTEKYPDFAFAYECARDCQSALLQEGMFGGFYDAGFAGGMLKRLFGWRDWRLPSPALAPSLCRIATRPEKNTSQRSPCDATFRFGQFASSAPRSVIGKSPPS